jgi:hypothetical protein
MKILRSVTRRGFSVGTAGYFAILKPNTWFPASRLPGNFRYRAGQSAGTAAMDEAGRQQTTIPPRIMILSTPDRRLLRPALVLLAAMGITSALLWWIMHP